MTKTEKGLIKKLRKSETNKLDKNRFCMRKGTLFDNQLEPNTVYIKDFN